MDKDLLTRQDLFAELRAAIAEHGTATDFARHHGFAQTYISQVLTRGMPPGPKIQAALGLRKVERYERVEQ